MIWGQLETRNFTFDAFGRDRDEVLNLLQTACHAHSLEYDVDLQYFLNLLDSVDTGNVRWTEIESGRAYRDHEEIVR